MTPARYRRLRAVLDRRQPDLLVVLDEVHKPHNIAAILRSCDAVGVAEVHAVKARGYVHRKATSAAGARRWVPVIEHPGVAAAIARVKMAGCQVVAAHPGPESVDFRALDYTGPTALLMGAELPGVSPAALAQADHQVTIPMLGMVASLNVSVATALLLYEAQRQREAAGLYAAARLDPERYARTLFEWGYPDVAAHCRERGIDYPPLDAEGIPCWQAWPSKP